MKKLLFILLTVTGFIAVSITLLIIYNTADYKPIIKNTENIKRITVNVYSVTKTTENKNDIKDIVNYINSLDLEKTSKNGYDCFGTNYFITVYYDHKMLWFDFKTRKKFVEAGNRYFRNAGNWYKINKFIDFTPVYENMNR